MPEPIAIASAASTIVVNGIKLCLSVYGTIDGMKQAPKHLKAVSSDLKAFYGVLGTIQIYLDDQELTQGLLQTQPSDNLQSILVNCVDVLQDFEKIVSGYIKAGQELSITKWQKVSWTWKLTEVEDLRNHLSDHKSSLNVAIGMANLINNDMARQASTSRMATDMQELREISAKTATQWADAKAELVALVAKLTRLDETMHDQDVIMQNQRATIMAFAHDAESILTSSHTETARTASFQVSTLEANSTRPVSFMTAWTSAGTGRAAHNGAVYPWQLLVCGIGSGTSVFRCSDDDGLFRYGHQLMTAVEKKLLVPTPYFWLAYEGKAIREETDMTFVPDGATVCANYRAAGAARKIIVEMPGSGSEPLAISNLDFKQNPTVADLKREIRKHTRISIHQQTLYITRLESNIVITGQEEQTRDRCVALFDFNNVLKHKDTLDNPPEIEGVPWTQSKLHAKLLNAPRATDGHTESKTTYHGLTVPYPRSFFGRLGVERHLESRNGTSFPTSHLEDDRTLASYSLPGKSHVHLCVPVGKFPQLARKPYSTPWESEDLEEVSDEDEEMTEIDPSEKTSGKAKWPILQDTIATELPLPSTPESGRTSNSSVLQNLVGEEAKEIANRPPPWKVIWKKTCYAIASKTYSQEPGPNNEENTSLKTQLKLPHGQFGIRIGRMVESNFEHETSMPLYYSL